MAQPDSLRWVQTVAEKLRRLPRRLSAGLRRDSRRAPEQSQGDRSRSSARQTDRRHRPERQRQIVPRFRHHLRRRPAPLRRNLLPLHAAIPRPHGQAAGRRNSRHSARDRDRAGEPGQEFALHRRHDDGDQRLPELLCAAHRAGILSRAAAARFGPKPRSRSPIEIVRELTRASTVLITFWVAVPAKTEPQRVLPISPAAGLPARLAQWRNRPRRYRQECRNDSARACRSSRTASTISEENRARLIEAIETALRFGKDRINVDRRSTRRQGQRAQLRRIVKSLSRPAGIARIAISIFARRRPGFSVSTIRSAPVRLPRFWPHHRDRSEPRDSRSQL